MDLLKATRVFRDIHDLPLTEALTEARKRLPDKDESLVVERFLAYLHEDRDLISKVSTELEQTSNPIITSIATHTAKVMKKFGKTIPPEC
ncbi:MAG: DUF1931 family protein [Armatimonadetes bacterium]|nr:DUF1931 family protein [Armatimonadota bacterium]